MAIVACASERLRLLAVCEDVPDSSPARANGSTLISSNVLSRLPPDIELTLACYGDGRAEVDGPLAARASSILTLPLRSSESSWALQPFVPVPRATWRRGLGLASLRALAEASDVVYAHGVHAFDSALAVTDAVERPLIVQEVDPRSTSYRYLASVAGSAARCYLSSQARRIRGVESRVAARAAAYLVVSEPDAEDLGRQLGRRVTAIPNGVLRASTPRSPDEVEKGVIGFLGTLSYPPNVAALRLLCEEILPRVRERVPHARVRIAGRRAAPAVRLLEGPHVEVLGSVDSAVDFFRSVEVAAYPGEIDTGAKNTVREALVAGTAVVASGVAARGLAQAGQLLVADGRADFESSLVSVLTDSALRESLATRAERWSHSLPTWDEVAAAYAREIRAVAPAAGPRVGRSVG